MQVREKRHNKIRLFLLKRVDVPLLHTFSHISAIREHQEAGDDRDF